MTQLLPQRCLQNHSIEPLTGSGRLIVAGLPAILLSCLANVSFAAPPDPLVVHNLADSGVGSLREAVETANAAPGADVIEFDVSGMIVLTSGELEITDDLAIDGPGADQVTISGDTDSRVFSISGSETDVVICGLTVADGRVAGIEALGGGILNDGANVLLVDMGFRGNEAVGEGRRDAIAGGGAVASIYGATLEVDSCAFEDNHASARNRSAGGAILNDFDSSLLVTGSEFVANSASGLYLDHNRLYGGNGGAIANMGHSSALLSSTIFARNQALGFIGKDVPGQYGGAAAGGAITNAPSMLLAGDVNLGPELEIEQCLFLENQAIAGAGGDAEGGVSSGPGGFAFGGALQNDIGAVATVSDCVFEENLAQGGDGGHSFSSAAGGAGHEAGGGAILTTRSRLTVVGTTFTNNQAVAGRGGSSLAAPGGGGDARGGVMHSPGFAGFAQPGPISLDPVVTFTDVLFQGNMAVGGEGGEGGSRGGKGGFARGGALSTNETTLTVSGAAFDANQAVGGEGGLGGALGDGGHAYGGAVSNGNEVADTARTINWLTMSHSELSANVTVGGGGTNAGSGFGGGVMNGARAEAVLSGCAIENNVASGGTGIVAAGDGFGGGIFNRKYAALALVGSSYVAMNTAIAGDDNADGFGGGVFAEGTVLVETLDAIFFNLASTGGHDWFGELSVIEP